jgi:hypothetical protein
MDINDTLIKTSDNNMAGLQNLKSLAINVSWIVDKLQNFARHMAKISLRRYLSVAEFIKYESFYKGCSIVCQIIIFSYQTI